MRKPLVFISHKHADRAIANVVRSFITEQTSGKVAVFQSSDPEAINPGVGRTLNKELRQALWDAGAVILIYTSPDQDWGYCMWECGVATLPESPDTRIVVFQCADASPNLFAGQVHVNARQKANIERFVVQFMTDATFLPDGTEALTGYERTAPEVQRAANKLFDDLQAVLPEGPVAEWPAHPFIQLQLSSSSTKRIAEAATADRPTIAQKVVSEAVVSDSDNYAHPLFGLAAFDSGLKFGALCDTWRAACPKASDAWIDNLVDQVGSAAQGQFPTLRWTVFQKVGETKMYAPVLTRVRKVPSISCMQFDVYFYPFRLLEATPGTSRMVRRADMFCRVLEPDRECDVNVFDLLDELDHRRLSRIPFVDRGDRFVYIVHRSMLDRFVARKVSNRNGNGFNHLTLADVLAEQPDARTMFASTAAFVSSEATLGEAKLAMNATRNCYDVFVTETGRPQEPVLGWITDVIIADSEPS
jgi:hypothetical protein